MTRSLRIPPPTRRRLAVLMVGVAVFFLGIVRVAQAELIVNVEPDGTGHGTVTSSDGAIDCGGPPATPNPPGACSASFLFSFTLHADPESGSVFNGWTVIRNGEPQSEACTSAAEDCSAFLFSNATYEIDAEFAVLLPPPTVMIASPTDVTSRGATFHGTVNPDGNDAKWHFEYRPLGSVSWASIPVPDRDAGAGETAEPVEGTAEGLEPNTEYEVRLWAGNGASAETSGIETFHTLALPPTVSTGGAFSVSDTTATLTATVNPNSAALTDCHFQYGTDAGYGQEAPCSPGPTRVNNPDEIQQIAVRATKGTFTLTFGGMETGPIAFDAPATVVQAELLSLSSIGSANVGVSGGPGDTSGSHPYLVTFEGALGDRDVEQLIGTMQNTGAGEAIAISTLSPGGFPVQVTTEVSDLHAGTAYHYRVVTTNTCGTGCGTTEAGDRSFETQAGIVLPQRHFELVSAADTNGEEALANLASVDGERYAYSSFLPSPPDPVSGFVSIYVSSRHPDGSWTQDGIEAAPGPGEGDVGTGKTFFSADLAKVALKTNNGLDPDDRNKFGDTYYLDQLAGRQFAWISRDPLLEGPQTEPGDAVPAYVTPDGADVLLESARALLPEALPGVTGLYEWSGGALGLVSLVPPPGARSCDGANEVPSCVAAPAGAILGSGVGEAGQPGTNYGAVSPDGRRVVFEVGANPSSRRLYVRIDGRESREVSFSALDSTPLDVVFGGADESDETIFFTSSSALTADSQASDTEAGPADLYSYDVGSEALHDLTPSPGGAGVERVYDVSDDGDRVYFTSSKRLDQAGGLTEEGQGLQGSPGGRNLYLAELDGSAVTLTFIATIDPTEGGPDGGLSKPEAWREVAASPDGSLLAFRDRLSPVPGRFTGGRPQVFVYDVLRHELSCASCSTDGSLPAGANLVPAKGNAEVEPGEGLAGDPATAGAGPHPRSVSTDGTVFFQTKTPLLPTDTNGRIDVYEWRNNKLALVSAGLGVQRSIFASASADGSTVFFQSADRLVPAAQAGIQHIYAARVGPALESPTPVPPCSGADCRGPASSPIGANGPGSAAFSGPGNQPARRTVAKRCGKRKVHKGNSKVHKGKSCVRKMSQHRGRHHRAGADRRAAR